MNKDIVGLILIVLGCIASYAGVSYGGLIAILGVAVLVFGD